MLYFAPYGALFPVFRAYRQAVLSNPENNTIFQNSGRPDMKVLAIRLARFGDIVLLLPALVELKSRIPGSHITLLTDQRLHDLAKMCPAIDEIIAVDRIAMRDGPKLASAKNMLRVVRAVRQRNFDLAIDFHGFCETNLLTWLSGARQRIGLKLFGRSFLGFCFNLPSVPEDKNLHEAAVFLKVVERFGTIHLPLPPALVVPEDSRQWAIEALPTGRFVGLYIDAPTPQRIWPADRFAAVASHLTSNLGVDVVVVSGPGGAPLVKRVLENSNSIGKIRGFSNLTAPQLAAVVQSASLWISNDTGPLHLGPCLGVPTLGLFSIGLPEHFRPTGPDDSYLAGNPIEKISVENVIERAQQMLFIDRPNLPR